MYHMARFYCKKYVRYENCWLRQLSCIFVKDFSIKLYYICKWDLIIPGKYYSGISVNPSMCDVSCETRYLLDTRPNSHNVDLSARDCAKNNGLQWYVWQFFSQDHICKNCTKSRHAYNFTRLGLMLIDPNMSNPYTQHGAPDLSRGSSCSLSPLADCLVMMLCLYNQLIQCHECAENLNLHLASLY